MVRSRRELAVTLSRAPLFPYPKRGLEQYVTDGETASELLWEAYMRGDIRGRVVLDLGCGTGVLAVGSAILGADHVICLDVDEGALVEAYRWAHSEGVLDRLSYVAMLVPDVWMRAVDTIVMNPPFGVYRRGADTMFLRTALKLRPRAIYTIHMSDRGTREVVRRTAQGAGYAAQILSTRSIMIPQLYESHRRRVYRVTVDLYRISAGE